MTGLPPFHLAFPVHDLAAARAFYGGLLGCPEGRSADDWVDFDFFGHQIVAHLVPGHGAARGTAIRSTAMTCRCRISARCWPWPSGRRWPARLEAAGVDFAIPPTVRFRGPARRAGDDVLPRSLRQRARDQGDARPGESVRDAEPVSAASCRRSDALP